MAAENDQVDSHEATPSHSGADVDMTESAEPTQTVYDHDQAEGAENFENAVMPFAEENVEPRISFIDYLMTPMVTLLVGSDKMKALTAHQGLLIQSPYFKEACKDFVDDGGSHQLGLADFELEPMGSFLEFLYTGDYFPRKLPGQRTLESDASIPSVDDSGDQLLKHARVYTLAEILGMPALKSLAQSKIHCVNSTAKGEVAYARYVYAKTAQTDTAIRNPVASFWATRSHTLRAEAEDEFKSLCLEYPQFGYDVLTRVLDDKLKRERNEKMHPGTSSTRKHARHSSGNV